MLRQTMGTNYEKVASVISNSYRYGEGEYIMKETPTYLMIIVTTVQKLTFFTFYTLIYYDLSKTYHYIELSYRFTLQDKVTLLSLFLDLLRLIQYRF